MTEIKSHILSLIERFEKDTKSPPKPLEIGLKKEELITELFNTLQEKHGYTTLTQSEKTLKIREKIVIPHRYSPEYCMLVYLAKNKKMTLQDKSKYFKTHIQTQKLFLTLDQELITKDEDSPSWWNESVEMKSEKLWLPTKIDYSDSDMSCLNKSVTNIMSTSWFSAEKITFLTEKIQLEKELLEKQKEKMIQKNFKKTCSASSTSLLPDKMGEEQENSEEKEKPNPNSLMKIKLYPTKEQRKKLCQVFDGNRWAYNTIIENTEDIFFKEGVKVKDIKTVSRPLVQKKTMIDVKYLKEVPEESLDSAYRDIWKARDAMLAASRAKKQKTGKGFHCNGLSHRSRRDTSQSVEIRSRAITFKVNSDNSQGVTFWKKFFGKNNSVIQIKEKNPPIINYSCRIKKTRLNNYYLCIPYYKEIKKSTTTKTCAIDPGVRTMLTGYDPEGYIFEFGKEIDKIMKRNLLIDKLKSKIRSFKGKRNKRYNLKTEELRITEKIKNMIKDCHHKVSKWLSETYRKILLPKFQTSEMVNKIKRGIDKKTARKMMAWSHYSFKELLKHKMSMHGNQLIECTEEYTSKTCTSCGRINHLLGASKNFKCPYKDCNVQIDRDAGASRNIYLKNHKLLEESIVC
jgi:putative transposase